jgi:RNA polymerase sigma factor (sigma-70 family)
VKKQRYIKIGGVGIAVSEEVYRAYKRPAWAERKRRQIRRGKERSLEAFMEAGRDIPSGQPLAEEIMEDKLLLEMLCAALDELTDEEQNLISALFYEERSEREVSKESGLPRKTIAYHKNKIFDKLRKLIKKS